MKHALCWTVLAFVPALLIAGCGGCKSWPPEPVLDAGDSAGATVIDASGARVVRQQSCSAGKTCFAGELADQHCALHGKLACLLSASRRPTPHGTNARYLCAEVTAVDYQFSCVEDQVECIESGGRLQQPKRTDEPVANLRIRALTRTGTLWVDGHAIEETSYRSYPIPQGQHTIRLNHIMTDRSGHGGTTRTTMNAEFVAGHDYEFTTRDSGCMGWIWNSLMLQPKCVHSFALKDLTTGDVIWRDDAVVGRLTSGPYP